jgi:hypothetical protein
MKICATSGSGYCAIGATIWVQLFRLEGPRRLRSRQRGRREHEHERDRDAADQGVPDLMSHGDDLYRGETSTRAS